MEQIFRNHKGLTQIIVDSLQGCTTLSQDVDFIHWLWFDFHSEGGDGMLIDAFCHIVIQTINQLPYSAIQFLNALSVLWLERREKDLISSMKRDVKTNPEF